MLSIALVAVLAGCSEPKADLSAPKTHQSGGITFDYPKNWTVTEDEPMPEFHYLFVETPGDALVIYQSYPQEDAIDLLEYVEAFSSETSSAIPIGEMTQGAPKTLPPSNGFDWVQEDFSINLLGEKTPHQRIYGSKVLGDRTLFLVLQVATEDAANVMPGFDLIRSTLRTSNQAAAN